VVPRGESLINDLQRWGRRVGYMAVDEKLDGIAEISFATI
jgi:hypothetical protein